MADRYSGLAFRLIASKFPAGKRLTMTSSSRTDLAQVLVEAIMEFRIHQSLPPLDVSPIAGSESHSWPFPHNIDSVIGNVNHRNEDSEGIQIHLIVSEQAQDLKHEIVFCLRSPHFFSAERFQNRQRTPS